jgi:hypothetical protein
VAEIPKTLGRYQLERELGRGMMGIVYMARDPELGRRVALKTIQVGFDIPESERAAFEKRFKQEAQAAAALSHPGIVVVHDVGQDPETKTPYIALEFMEGRTLAELTAGAEPMPWPKAARLVAQLAEALAHAHAKGIVHRDIKPANIMVLDSGQSKVMDFGIAKLPASTLTTTGEFFGTPAYMSPEQARGDAVDPRTDLFSLGCVLYQLLTGRKPFDGPSLPVILMRVMQESPPPPSSLQPGLPAAFDQIVARALAKDRGQRYADGRALAEDLEDAAAGKPPRHAGTEPAEIATVETRVTADVREVALEPRSGPGQQTARLEGILAAAAGTSIHPARPSTRRRHRRLFIGLGAAALLALGFAGALVIPWGGQPAVLTVPSLAPALLSGPAQLELTVDHPLRSGVLKVWVDDKLVLEEGLEGHVSKKVLSYEQHKGSLKAAMEVPAGQRVVRVQVEGDGFAGSRRIKGTFTSGVTRKLYAEVSSGLLKKELKLGWSS